MDTHDKRDSAINLSLPWRMRLPLPGTLTVADRLHVAFLYRGIAAAGIVAGPYRYVALDTHTPGSVAASTHVPGSVAGATL